MAENKTIVPQLLLSQCQELRGMQYIPVALLDRLRLMLARAGRKRGDSEPRFLSSTMCCCAAWCTCIASCCRLDWWRTWAWPRRWCACLSPDRCYAFTIT